MHADRREVVLARQHEGQRAVAHQRQTLAVGAVDGIDHARAADLGADLLGQFGDIDGPDIDDRFAVLRSEIERCVHLRPSFISRG